MTTKVFDTFDGVAGTDLADHTPNTDVVGSGWNDSATNVVELDGIGGIKFAGNGSNSRINVGTTDQWCTANWNSGGSDNRVGIHLRNDDTAIGETGYQFNFRPGDGTGTAYIYKFISGSATELARATSLGLNTSTTYSMEPEINGSSLDFIVDGDSKVSVTDTSVTTGSFAKVKHALWVDGNARFHDFQIDDAAPVSAGIEVFRRRMIIRKSA